MTVPSDALALEVRDLEVAYGPIPALRGASLGVPAGEVTAVLGANGAGKSTLVRAVTGIVAPSSGLIRLFGLDITGAEPHVIAQRGLGVVPEGRHVFPRLSVHENLIVGTYVGRLSRSEREARIEAQYARFPALRDRRGQQAGTLSGGEQQMLAIARALVARPRLLVLDEPSLGLAPRVVEELYALMEDVWRGGTAVLLIEQSVRLARRVARHAFVFAAGRVARELDAAQLQDDDLLRAAYLGVDPASASA